MEQKRGPGVRQRVTGSHIALKIERPQFHLLQVKQPNELRPGFYYLIVRLVDKLTVTLVRVVNPPRPKGRDWVVDITKLVAKNLEMPGTISLAEHSVIPMADSWSGSACIIKTAPARLPESGDHAELLSKEDRKKLEEQVITLTEIKDMEEVDVAIDDS